MHKRLCWKLSCSLCWLWSQSKEHLAHRYISFVTLSDDLPGCNATQSLQSLWIERCFFLYMHCSIFFPGYSPLGDYCTPRPQCKLLQASVGQNKDTGRIYCIPRGTVCSEYKKTSRDTVLSASTWNSSNQTLLRHTMTNTVLNCTLSYFYNTDSH